MWVEKRLGRFCAIERYKDPATGKLKRVSVTMAVNTAQSRKTALSALQRIIQNRLVPLTDRITLGELIDAYLKDHKTTVRISTYNRDRIALNTIMKILGPKTLCSSITAGYVREKLRDTGKEPVTLNGYIARYKPLIHWAYENDYILSTSHIDKLKLFPDRPHREKIQDKYLDADELKEVLKVMTVETWRLLTQFMALSGLRFGEAAALDVSDVDLSAKTIHVYKTYDVVNDLIAPAKTIASHRDVHMQPALIQAARETLKYMRKYKFQIGASDKPYFFVGPNGGRIQVAAFNKHLGIATMKVKGQRLTSHALRHTHASLLMAQGIGIDAISRRLGHENSLITREIYLHITKQLEEADAKALDAVTLW